MIYNAIVAANFSLPLKLSENAHCRVVNDQVVYPFLLMADIELICRLTKSIACLSFSFVWTFLLKTRSLFRGYRVPFRSIGPLRLHQLSG